MSTSKKNVDFMNYWKNFKTVDFYAMFHQNLCSMKSSTQSVSH